MNNNPDTLSLVRREIMVNTTRGMPKGIHTVDLAYSPNGIHTHRMPKSAFGVDLGEYQKGIHTVDFLITS